MRQSTELKVFFFFLVAFATGLFAAGTWHGIGMRPDSMAYLGLSPDRFQQAPTYTALIDLLAGMGVQPVLAATVLNILSLILNITLMFLILNDCKVRPRMIFLAALIMVLSPQFMYAHVTILSEPLTTNCLLGTYFFMSRYLRGDNVSAFVLASCLAALCVLTRFALVPLIAACSLTILVYGHGDLRRRLVSAIVFGLIASAIIIGWYLYNQTSGGTGIGRQAAFLGDPDTETFRAALTTLSAYVLPSSLPPIITLTALVVVLGFVIALIGTALKVQTNPDDLPGLPVARTISFFLLVYVPFLVLALFIEANLTIHARYLLPVFISTLVLGFALVGGQPGTDMMNRLRPAALILALALTGTYAVRTAAMTRTHMTEGNFYASPVWKNSPTLAHLDNLRDGVVVYSNGYDVIRLVKGVDALKSPELFERRTGRPDLGTSPEKEIQEVRKRVADQNAVVAILNEVDWRFYLVDEERLIREADLTLLYEEADGRIYGSPDSFKPIE